METKKHYCSHCKAENVPLIKYSKKKNNQYYQCRTCNNARQRKYYSENKERCRAIIYKSTAKHAHKQYARLLVHEAIRHGTLVRPSTCEECSATQKIQAHHTDYSQPLVVQWLCVDCHCKKHKQ